MARDLISPELLTQAARPSPGVKHWVLAQSGLSQNKQLSSPRVVKLGSRAPLCRAPGRHVVVRNLVLVLPLTLLEWLLPP